MSEAAVRAKTEAIARESYGRLLAILASRSRDIALSEDALAEAMLSAIRHWPEAGIPANPEAWILTAARNTLKSHYRHQGVAAAAEADLVALFDTDAPPKEILPDERLKLMFLCAHPEIDQGLRAPLMLQTILGLDATRIASAFLVAPSTMGQRLVRVKARIKELQLPFEAPDIQMVTQRLSDVLEAIYAAYGFGWESPSGSASGTAGLAAEAIYLGRVLVHLLPGEAEAQGLLALMLYCEARKPARRDALGRFVPLDRQDARLWSRDLIIEAENLLTAAAQRQTFGRFQCEAAIQSVHVQRPITGKTNTQALETLHRLLLAQGPRMGVSVSLAAVLADDGRPAEALQLLDSLDQKSAQTYQPYWVTRAKVLQGLGDQPAALQCLQLGIGLTEDEAVRAFLRSLLPPAGTDAQA